MSAHRTQTPSPDALPESRSVSPIALGRNLQVDGGTPESLLPTHPVPKPLLDAWNEKYNRSSMRLMTQEDFEDLVASIKRESRMSAATHVELEAALAERLQRDATRLQSQLSDMKAQVLSDLDRADGVANLLPLIREDTQHGWSQYILQTLSMHPATNDITCADCVTGATTYVQCAEPAPRIELTISQCPATTHNPRTARMHADTIYCASRDDTLAKFGTTSRSGTEDAKEWGRSGISADD